MQRIGTKLSDLAWARSSSPLLSAFGLLEASPLALPLVRQDQRRILLRRFPYSLIYRVLSGEVVVIACRHGKQHPRRSRSRR
jgi:plasmid stabilization system protein ParE